MPFDFLFRTLDRVNEPATAHAHCDLPCGVYNPAQARIEAESVHEIQKKYQDASDDEFKQRAVRIKEDRAELVKYHLWVLWTDYFKPHHLEQYPDVHEKFWQATKSAGEAKKSTDPSQGQKLLDQIDELADIFWKTKQAG